MVPAFQPSEKLVEVVRRAVLGGFTQIIVIDDGSGEAYKPIFEECQTFSGVTLLKNEVNQGKGYSLKKSFQFIENNFRNIEGVVTADADGQHLPEDIFRVRNELHDSISRGENSVILGSRNFRGADVPPRSKFGNIATTGLIRLLYGIRVEDTQTGLRGIPTEHLASLQRVKGSRFEWEMNSLLDLMNRKIPLVEIEIATVYHDLSNSQSHFRPVRDSIQIWFQILRFTLSSLTGAAVDLGVYSLIILLFFTGSVDAVGITVATVIARVCSGLTNYFVNRQIVFVDGNKVRVSLTRYVILALILVSASALGTVVLANVFDGHAIAAKVIVDVGLYVLSFIVQKRWVFTKDLSLEV